MIEESNAVGDPELPGSGSKTNVTSGTGQTESDAQDTVAYEEKSGSELASAQSDLAPSNSTGDPELPGSGSTNT